MPHPEIVALHAADAAAIEAHLLRLDAASRSLRFAAGVVTDDTIRRYVDRLAFGRDAVLGIAGDDGRLVAFAHGSVYDVAGRLRIEASFSVDASRRREGLASALMRGLGGFAERTGAEALVAMCVARNLPMRRLFETSGMRTVREDDEIHASRPIGLADVLAR